MATPVVRRFACHQCGVCASVSWLREAPVVPPTVVSLGGEGDVPVASIFSAPVVGALLLNPLAAPWPLHVYIHVPDTRCPSAAPDTQLNDSSFW